MSALKIAVKNYEAIENLSVTFNEGFTCIIGQSNQGKSALFRAIERILFNKHSDEAVRWGEESYLIGMEYNGNKVICKRNPNKGMKTSYNVNGKTIEKVGRNCLEEVDNALRMHPIDIGGSSKNINLIPQFSYPFMLDLTPGKLYNFLSQSSNQEDLSGVIKSMKDDLRTITDNQKKLEGVVAMAKEMYDKEHVVYNNLVSSDFAVESILNLQSKVSSVNNLNTLTTRIDLASVDIGDTLEILKSVDAQLEIMSKFDTLLEDYKEQEELSRSLKITAGKASNYRSANMTLESFNRVLDSVDLTGVESLISEFNAKAQDKEELGKLINSICMREELYDKYCKTLESIAIVEKSTTKFDNYYEAYHLNKSVYNELLKIHNKLETTTSALASVEDDLSYIDNELLLIDKELSEFEYCPTCGHSIKKGEL